MMRSIQTLLGGALLGVMIASCGGEAAPDREDDLNSLDEATAPGQAIFETSCFACHSIGEGDRIGPDLQDVHLRREREWLVGWLQNSIEMAQSDSIGRELFAEFQNVPMPPSGLSDEAIGQVLDYLQAVSISTRNQE